MPSFCAVIGCANKQSKHPEKSYYRLPSIVTRYGPQKEELTRQRREKWLNNISRADITESKAKYLRVCSDHFVNGKPAPLECKADHSWAPTLKLGHNKLSPKRIDNSYSGGSEGKEQIETPHVLTHFFEQGTVEEPAHTPACEQVKKNDDEVSRIYTQTLFTHTSPNEKKRLRKVYDNRKEGENIMKIGTSHATGEASTSSSGNQTVDGSEQHLNSSSGPKIEGSDSETSCNLEFMEPETLLYCLDETENRHIESSLGDNYNKSHKRKKKSPKVRPKIIGKVLYDDSDYVDLKVLGSGEDTDSAPEVQSCLMQSNSVTDQSTQTILQHTYIKNLEDECYNLRCELSRIKGKYMFKDMELEMFKDSDEKVKYLTGLDSYDMLKALSDILSEYQRNLARLSCFQQLMVTLMKLKLNLPLKFFAVLFNVHLTAISRLFNETMDLLFKKLVPLYIIWPNKDDVRRILPPDLSDCQNCVYITGTFEVQIDLLNGASVACNNKMDGINNPDVYHPPTKGQTIRKYFMSIAPQGSVIFISKGVVGEVSDRTIALESGFFENIAPGDVILTEKELDIDDAVGVMDATLRNSNSVKSPSQALMNPDEEGPKRLVRIKRVIQLLKKRFTILDNKIPINWVKISEKNTYTMLDKIVQVVCALSNMTNKVWTYERFLMPNNQNIPC